MVALISLLCDFRWSVPDLRKSPPENNTNFFFLNHKNLNLYLILTIYPRLPMPRRHFLPEGLISHVPT